MKRRLPLLPFLFLGLILFAAAPALAARAARVDQEGVELRQGPGKTFPALDKMHKNAPVAASNLPTEGYYKVRTINGQVGWLPADSLVLEESQEGAKGDPVGKGKGERRFLVRPLGGMSLFNISDVNGATGMTAFRNGIHVGAEFGYLVAPGFHAILRAEWIGKSVVATSADSTTGSYRFDANSYPVFGGMEVRLYEDSGFSFDLGLLAGMGLMTRFAITSSVTNSYTSSPFGVLGKMNINYRITKAFGLFVEGGFRYLASEAHAFPADTVDSEILKVNGAFVPISVNLTGPVFSGGLVFSF